MRGVTITQLQEELADNLERQEVAAIVLQGVKEMGHYKQVNKRFADHLESKGICAHIWNENEDTNKLRVYRGQNYKNEMTLYRYGKKLTWELITQDLERYQLKGREEAIRKSIACHAEDVATLREVWAFILSKKTCYNFYLDTWCNELQYAIRDSEAKA